MTMEAKFSGTCKTCGGAIAVGEFIEWERGTGARHKLPVQCEAAKATKAVATVPTPTVDGIGAVVAFLQAARDRGLKFPKARFLAPGGGELRLSLAGDQSKYPGSVQVKVDSEWIGRVEASGATAGRAFTGTPAMIATMIAIAKDPAAAAKAYGALMCRCSFCNLALTDEGSVEAGYGPICARNWGLPHTAVGTKAVKQVPVEVQ